MLSCRKTTVALLLALSLLVVSGCGLGGIFSSQDDSAGFLETQTNEVGQAKIKWGSDNILVKVHDSEGNPIDGATIEAYESQDEVLLFIDKEGYTPQLKRITRSDVETLQLQAAEIDAQAFGVGATLLALSSTAYIVVNRVITFFVLNPQVIDLAMMVADIIKYWDEIVSDTRKFAITSVDKLSEAFSDIKDKAIILVHTPQGETHGFFLRIKNSLLYRKETIKAFAQSLIEQLEVGKDAVVEYVSYKYRQIKGTLSQGLFLGDKELVDVPVVEITVEFQ